MNMVASAINSMLPEWRLTISTRHDVDTSRFSKSQFMEQINQCAPLKFRQCIMMVQVIQAARGSVTETTATADENVFKGGVNDENYKQKMLHVLSIFDRKGWLVN